MGAEVDFPTDNWFRNTRRYTFAEVIAHCLTKQIQDTALNKFTEGAAITTLSEQGWSNFSFLVHAKDSSKWLLRMKRKPNECHITNWSSYHKERWCQEAQLKIVPVPKIPRNGIGYVMLTLPSTPKPVEFAFIIQEYIDGCTANTIAELGSSPAFFRKLGEIASQINNTKTLGYGESFEAHSNTFKETLLANFFEREYVELEHSIRTWFQHRPELFLCIKQRILSLGQYSHESHLAHRDFLSNWGNVIVNSDKEIIGVIDWEFAFSGPAFYLEMASLVFTMVRDGATVSEREKKINWILEGYGISKRNYNKLYRDAINNFALWHALRTIQKYVELQKQGLLVNEPWRKLFAERATRFVYGAFGAKSRDRSTVFHQKVAL